MPTTLPLAPKVLPTRPAREIFNNRLSVGGETLDRSYADFSAWAPYLGPLGCKRVRLQSGWAKTESSPGQYDFQWLCAVVDECVKQSVRPWISLGYHNPLYRGEISHAAALPQNNARAAWLKYVTAAVRYFRSRVREWEIWNEPNALPDRNTPAVYAQFAVDTARAIRIEQPDAFIHFGAFAGVPMQYAHDVLEVIRGEGMLRQFDSVTYHPYEPNPDSTWRQVEAFRSLVTAFDPRLQIMQGECGAPSSRNHARALADIDWTELSQAKYALRRLVGDLARGIDSSLFSISDMHYPDEVSRKGLLLTGDDRRVVRPKLAYRAVQHVTAVFDNRVEPTGPVPIEAIIDPETDDRVTAGAFGFEHANGGRALAIWRDGDQPGERTDWPEVDVELQTDPLASPFMIDLLGGHITKVTTSQVHTWGAETDLCDLPIGDWPILVCDRAFLSAIVGGPRVVR